MNDYYNNLKRKHKGWLILALIYIAVMLLVKLIASLFTH